MKLCESIVNRSALHCCACILIFTCFLRSGLCSRITFQDGAYNNILVAIHPDTDPRNCVQLVQNITEAFKTASSYLELATNGLSRFGTIRILIPPNWGEILPVCGIPEANITESAIDNTYEGADFKITKNHPFAAKLPWTKQYKGCENESDSIFVPPNFYSAPNFDASTRGRILLHEWAKFRYGVFEEYGYYNDPIFSPCFSMGGKDLFTSCVNVELDSLRDSGTKPITDQECRLALQQKSTLLLAQIKSASASIMFAPHLGNMMKFCTNETQFGLAPTKQNVLCERKSVSEVVFSHEDFQQVKSDMTFIFPNTRGIRTPRIEPIITLVRHSSTLDQGYAFLLEDDAALREFGRLQHVKQGIAQILRLAKDQSQIAIAKYDGIVFRLSEPMKLESDDKARILSLGKVPGSGTIGLQDRYKISRSNRLFNDKNRSIKNIIESLSKYSHIKWEIIQVTSSPPANIEEAIAEIRGTRHSLTIFTYDTSKEWLQFNTIPNTNKVVFLPRCVPNDMACHGTTSSLFADHFAQILATNTSATNHFVHKVVDFSFDGGAERTFYINSEDFVQNIDNFHFLLPIYEENTKFTITSPTYTNCEGMPLLGYNLVLTVDSTLCPYQVGTWKVRVSGTASSDSFRYTLQGYGESRNSDHDLVISTSFGRKISLELFPSTGSLPVYVSVTNELEQPIIYAEAELRILHENQNFTNLNETIQLLDNGMDPDLTLNDGIYSGYVKYYNSDPSYHTGQVRVTTSSAKTKAIVSIGTSGEAVLLDSDMASKCCGSSIPFTSVTSVGRSAYSIVLPSFRTGETIKSTSDIFPPSKISSPISKVQTNLEEIVLEFTAPGSDYSEGTVAHYDICCTNSSIGNLDDSLCNPLKTTDCVPVPSGSVQSCKVILRDLALGFLNDTEVDLENSTKVSFYCGLRGVDDVGNAGPISATLFEVSIDPRIIVEGFGECKYISDGCLPVDIFWALIGCLGGLVLLLFIVLLCWFCSSRKKKKALKNATDDGLNSVRYIGGFPEDSGHPPLHNVYINQAYIQDSNGQLKLVASDGELLSFDTPENGRFPSEPGVRRRSVSGTDSGARKHVSWNGGEDHKDMPVLLSGEKRAHASSAVSLPQMDTRKSYSAALPPRPSQESLPDERVQVQLRSNFRPQSETAQTLNIPRIDNSQSIPSISSTIDQQQDSGPVYASVTRAGRKSSPYSSGTGYTPSFNPPVTPASVNSPAGQFPPSYSIASTVPPRPLSNKSPAVVPPQRVLGPASSAAPTPKYIHNRPPIRMDHFPSSESEVYSDMSHIIPNSNRGTTTGNIPVSSSPAHNFSRNIGTRQLNGPARNSSPPKGTGFGVGRRDVPNVDVNRPRVFPPPPPPPRQSVPNAGVNPPRNQNQSQEDEEYDDDSDNWDNYDDFEFTNPYAGSSFA